MHFYLRCRAALPFLFVWQMVLLTWPSAICHCGGKWLHNFIISYFHTPKILHFCPFIHLSILLRVPLSDFPFSAFPFHIWLHFFHSNRAVDFFPVVIPQFECRTFFGFLKDVSLLFNYAFRPTRGLLGERDRLRQLWFTTQATPLNPCQQKTRCLLISTP